MAAHFESGMFVKEPAWHGLGTVLQDAPKTAAEAIAAAGMDWEVEKVPLFMQNVISDVSPYVDFPLSYGIVRKTDRSILGSVGPQYTPVQNTDMFGWFDPFVESGECSYHTAGSLFDGQKVWVLCQLNRDNSVIVKDDELSKFLLISNSHDGKNSVRVGFSHIRIVCANTLAQAHNDKRSKLIRIRHSSKVLTNLNNIRETVDAINADFEATAEQFRRLAVKGVNQKDLEKFVRILMDVDTEIPAADIGTRKKNLMQKVFDLIEAENKTSAAKDTWWTCYNGYNSYLQHHYGRNAENRVDNLWFGTGVADNQKAFSLALEFANAA